MTKEEIMNGLKRLAQITHYKVNPCEAHYIINSYSQEDKKIACVNKLRARLEKRKAAKKEGEK